MIKKLRSLPKNVFSLGWVSFFNDIASEMTYPLIPIFVKDVLGAPVAAIGLIEGIANATSNILGIFSGYFSDKLKKRKPFIVAGYSFSAISKLMLGLSYAWPLVLLARFVDRFGKGTRTAARDALITQSTPAKMRGVAFGFHRSLDSAGALLGPLITFFLLMPFYSDYRVIFSLSALPAFFGVLILLLFVEEAKHERPTNLIKFHWKTLSRKYKEFLIISMIFSIGNSSIAFPILKAQSIGLSSGLIMFIYALYQLSYTVLSTPAGLVADKIGSRLVMATGFALYGGVYFTFGITDNVYLAWLLFLLYGAYAALTDGISKAYISELVAKENIGSAFGIYQMLVGSCMFFASLIAGFMWTYVGDFAPFIFGGTMSIIAGLLLAARK